MRVKAELMMRSELGGTDFVVEFYDEGGEYLGFLYAPKVFVNGQKLERSVALGGVEKVEYTERGLYLWG